MDKYNVGELTIYVACESKHCFASGCRYFPFICHVMLCCIYVFIIVCALVIYVLVPYYIIFHMFILHSVYHECVPGWIWRIRGSIYMHVPLTTKHGVPLGLCNMQQAC